MLLSCYCLCKSYYYPILALLNFYAHNPIFAIHVYLLFQCIALLLFFRLNCAVVIMAETGSGCARAPRMIPDLDPVPAFREQNSGLSTLKHIAHYPPTLFYTINKRIKHFYCTFYTFFHILQNNLTLTLTYFCDHEVIIINLEISVFFFSNTGRIGKVQVHPALQPSVGVEILNRHLVNRHLSLYLDYEND